MAGQIVWLQSKATYYLNTENVNSRHTDGNMGSDEWHNHWGKSLVAAVRMDFAQMSHTGTDPTRGQLMCNRNEQHSCTVTSDGRYWVLTALSRVQWRNVLITIKIEIIVRICLLKYYPGWFHQGLTDKIRQIYHRISMTDEKNLLPYIIKSSCHKLCSFCFYHSLVYVFHLYFFLVIIAYSYSVSACPSLFQLSCKP